MQAFWLGCDISGGAKVMLDLLLKSSCALIVISIVIRAGNFNIKGTLVLLEAPALNGLTSSHLF